MNIESDAFGVPADLTRQVFAAQLQLRDAYRDSLRVGARLGALLAQAKEACGHGGFEKWLVRHFDGSSRHARRLMQLANSYPDPERIPALSLHEALRLIRGSGANAKAVMAHDRLSGTTCSEILATFAEVLKQTDKRVIGALELEGVTARHPAMKAAKKLAADVRRLRAMVESLSAKTDVGLKQEERGIQT